MELIVIFIAVIFFILGFYQGRKNKKKTSVVDKYSQSYAQGLNYLLADESDKAIQLFVDLIKVDGETAETHLALGKLFRSRGEVDKAIKIHLNILAKPSLDLTQRVQVLFELAKDYLKAGLLDRSENVFKELLELDKDNIQALVYLQNIYISEKSWMQAIVYSERLKRLKYKDSQQILTHCYCELAEIKSKSKEFHLARQYIQIALDFDSQCVRAFILRLSIELEERKFSAAEKTLNNLMKNHSDQVDLYLSYIYELFNKQNKMDQYASYLLKYNKNYTNKVINIALLNYFFEHSDISRALSMLDQVIAESADLELYELALTRLNINEFGDDKYQALARYLQRYNENEAHYNCTHCGYSSQGMQWQCPSCNSWSTMALIQNTLKLK